MKNLMIAMLASYIFYTDFCVVKMPALVPFIVVVFWLTACVIEEAVHYVMDFREDVRRGEKLARRIRRLKNELL